MTFSIVQTIYIDVSDMHYDMRIDIDRNLQFIGLSHLFSDCKHFLLYFFSWDFKGLESHLANRSGTKY